MTKCFQQFNECFQLLTSTELSPAELEDLTATISALARIPKSLASQSFATALFREIVSVAWRLFNDSPQNQLIGAGILTVFSGSDVCSAAAEQYRTFSRDLSKKLFDPLINPQVLLVMQSSVVPLAKDGEVPLATMALIWKHSQESQHPDRGQFCALFQAILEVLKPSMFSSLMTVLADNPSLELVPMLVGVILARKTEGSVVNPTLALLLRSDFGPYPFDIMTPLASKTLPYEARKAIMTTCRDILQNGHLPSVLHLLTLIAKELGYLKSDFDGPFMQVIHDCFAKTDDHAPFIPLFEILIKGKAMTFKKAMAVKLYKLGLFALLLDLMESLSQSDFERDVVEALHECIVVDSNAPISLTYVKFMSKFICVLNVSKNKMYVRSKTGGVDYVAREFPFLE
jgi:hypothetical protein